MPGREVSRRRGESIGEAVLLSELDVSMPKLLLFVGDGVEGRESKVLLSPHSYMAEVLE